MQALALMLPAGESEFSVHDSQLVAPAAPWYVPGAHAVQPEAPAAPAYEPGVHVWHLDTEAVQFPDVDDTTVTPLSLPLNFCSEDRMRSPSCCEISTDEILTEAAAGFDA